MTIKDYFSIALSIIASLGGGAIIIFAFSNWLGKVWATRLMQNEKHQRDQELETFKNTLLREADVHRVKLKKSELVFQKEFEAASRLVELRRSIYPKYRYPDMEWEDACHDVALSFSSSESKLESYLSTHGAALPDDVTDQIVKCIDIAADGKFHVNEDIDSQILSEADKFLKFLEGAERTLLIRIRSQSGI